MKQTVTIVGLGYVGKPLLELLVQSQKYTVIGYDIQTEILVKLRLAYKKKAFFTHIPEECFPQSDVIVVCVPTPVTAQKKPQLKALAQVFTTLSRFLKKGQLIIVESTVYPGVCEKMLLPLLEKSGLQGGKDFELSHCPERINPGDTQWPVSRIPRNIGSLTAKGAFRTRQFYQSFLQGDLHTLSSLKEAEATKLVENVFRDVNIAFVNELAQAFDRMEIDAVNVITAAASKPFSFLAHFPGCGVGGDCIATDPYYYQEGARQVGFTPSLSLLSRKLNESMPAYLVTKAEKALQAKQRKFSDSKIAVLGLAYKPEIADTRNAPASAIKRILTRKKASFVTYDPFITDEKSVSSLEKALAFADVIMVCTAHKEFIRKLTPSLLRTKKIMVVADGRNCLNKQKITQQGIEYVGVGR